MGEKELAGEMAKKLKQELEDWKVEISNYKYTDMTKNDIKTEILENIYKITVTIIEKRDFVKTTEILQNFAKL